MWKRLGRACSHECSFQSRKTSFSLYCEKREPDDSFVVIRNNNSATHGRIFKIDYFIGKKMSQNHKTFRERKSFTARKRDSETITKQYPDKIPVIVERFSSEKSLPILDKIKYLVPSDLSMSSLAGIIRKRLQLSPTQAFYLMVNERNMVSNSLTVGELHRDEKHEDGFLYMVYASQETFG